MATKKSESKEVVNWKEQLKSEATAVAKAERPDVSFISLKAGVITANGGTVKELPCVIVAAGYERTYYDKPYVDGEVTSPACFAQSMEESMLAPHENVAEPQGSNCATCPMAQWGSSTTGSGKGQACKIRRKLALLPYPAEDYSDAEMAVLALPPTSGKYYGSYANRLATQLQVPPWAAATKITTEPDAKTQFKVNFTAIEELPEESLGAVHGRIEAAEQVLLVPYDTATPGEEAPESNKY